MVVQGQEAPAFGRQRIQLLSNGQALVHTTSETMLANKGEGREAFLVRLAEMGVGPEDEVELVYKGGWPQYAVVTWQNPRKGEP